MKDKIIGFFSGAAFGAITTIPGLSGGTMLVVCGCYDRICQALSLDFKAIKKDIFYLAIFAIGVIAGLLGFAHAIAFMINRFPLIAYLLFSALILVGIPVVIRKMDAGEKISPRHIIPALLGCALVTLLFIAEMSDVSGSAKSTPPALLVLYTALAGVAQIIPGVSGAFMLVIFGVYETVISAVTELDIGILVFVAIGVLLGLVGGSRLVTFLLKKAKTAVYSAIIGMLVASAAMLAIDTIMKYA